MTTFTKQDIGERVTFKLTVCNWNPRMETKVIRNVLDDGRITVRHNGFDNFVLRADEKLTNGNKTIDGKCEIKVPAIFYAFVPKRVVKLITPTEAKDEDLVENLKKRGITPLVGITDGKGNVSESFELEEWKNKQPKKRKAKKKGVKLVKPRLKKKSKRNKK